jgi:hypothetical protein
MLCGLNSAAVRMVRRKAVVNRLIYRPVSVKSENMLISGRIIFSYLRTDLLHGTSA